MTTTAVASSWGTVALRDCCDIVAGSTPSREVAQFWDGPIPWATPKDLSDLDSPVLENTPEGITQEGFDSCSTQMLPKGAVLFSSRAPIGLVAIAGRPMCTNQGFKSFVPGPGVDSLYLYYCLKSMVPQIQARGNGATFKEVSKEVIGTFEIPIPFPDDPRRSLAEQKRIAAILDKADAIRRRRQEAARLADTLIPSVFYEMFGDPVLNPRRYDTEPLGSLADMVSGGTPSKSVPEFWTGSLPWVSPKDMKRPYLADATDHITEDGADDANLKVLQPGAILIVVRGMILAHTVPLAINLAPLTINQDMRAFVPHDGIEAEYLCWALRMQHGRLLSLVTNAAHGTKRFESRDLFALSVPLPPKPQQKRFAALVESTRLARQRWEAGSDNAEDFFNSLVQRAFRGEL